MAEKNSNIKTMSKKGKEVTAELEKLTGINLSEEDKAVENKEAADTTTSESKIQDIKDVDLGEDNAMKPLLFKCPNDMYLSIRKDSGEMIIDESCCTVLSVMVKNTGEINTNFSGSHNPDLVKVLSRAVKKYMRELRRKLKSDYKIAREELELKSEEIPEEMKFDASKEVETTRPWNAEENEENSKEKPSKQTAKKPSTTKSKSATKTTQKSTTKPAAKSTTKTQSKATNSKQKNTTPKSKTTMK